MASRFFAAFLLFWAVPALAYVQTVTPAGVPVRWKGQVKLDLAGNPTNQVGLSPSDVFNAVVHGLQRWNQVSGGVVGFDYWQGTDPTVYEPNSNFNGLSSVYFVSNQKGGVPLSPSVLGLTQVWYDTKTGEILETDIALNDINFHFTTNPSDTSGFGSGGGSNGGTKPNVFIENVLTHEIGHALGLSHSAGLQSTMLYMESPEQAHIGCDEAVAIRALYPAGDASQRGSISGSVVSDSGAPIFGAHVLAISRRRGTVLATGLTNPSGTYSIDALEPGDYYLIVEPFFAGSAPLPAYYSGIDDAICPDTKAFGRSALTDSSGYLLQPVVVSAGHGTSAPNLVAHCSSANGAAIATIPSSDSSSSAPSIFDANKNLSGFGVADKFDSSSPRYYKLSGLAGDVEIHVLAYSLYSPIHAQVSLLDSSGNAVSDAAVDTSAYTGDSGYQNFDTDLKASGLSAGDYYVEVSETSLDASYYPAGPVSLDSQRFFVVTGSVNEGPPPLSDALPTNARCRQAENFSSYSSPPGPPPRHAATSQNNGGVGFCGTLSTESGPKDDDSSGPGPGAILGWFAPWLFMLGAAQIMMRSTRRLASRGPSD